MRKPRQLNFPTFQPRLEHGGTLAEGRRKTRRPFDPRRALHLVLKADLARGPRSMAHPKHERFIARLLTQVARRRGVRVYRFANAGNHLHLLMQSEEKANLQRFLKELAGRIAMRITGSGLGTRILRSEVLRDSQRAGSAGIISARDLRRSNPESKKIRGPMIQAPTIPRSISPGPSVL